MFEALELIAYIFTFTLHMIFDIIIGISNIISGEKPKEELKAA